VNAFIGASVDKSVGTFVGSAVVGLSVGALMGVFAELLLNNLRRFGLDQ